MIYKFLLLLLQQIMIVYCEKFLKIDYFNILGSYHLRLLLGKKLYVKYFEINLDRDVSIMSNSYYRPSKETKIYSKGSYDYTPNQNLEYQLMSELYYFENSRNIQRDSLFFYYFDRPLPTYDCITFSHKIFDKRFLLTYVLKKQRIIDKLKFAFVPGKYNNGNLFFGGIPPEILSNLYPIIFQIDTRYSGWDTLVANFKIGVEEYKRSHYGSFQTRKRYIYAPKGFTVFLHEKIFKNYISNKTCVVVEHNSKQLYQCYDEILNTFPSISITLDNVVISFNNTHLFTCDYSQCTFLVIENKENDNWEIGNCFMEMFSMEFDYDSNCFTIYIDRKNASIKIINLPYINSKIIIIIITIILNGLGISILFVTYFFNFK